MAKKSKKQHKETKKNPKNSLAEALQRSNTNSPSSAASVMVIKQMSAQQLALTAVLWLVAHTAIIYLANQFFPASVVLGTNLITPMMGLVYSMVVFTLIAVGAIPVIEAISAQMKWQLSNLHWFALFLVVDVVGLWIVARFAEQLGMGISWWLVALVLGLVMDVVQGFLVKVADRS